MVETIRKQKWPHYLFYLVFGAVSLFLLIYYLSFTVIHFTTPQQFPINSFERLPLSILIFPAEVFSFLFALYFVYILFMDAKRKKPMGELDNKRKTPLAILLPVYEEPKDVVERTISHAKKVRWLGKVNVYLLDDSRSDKGKKEMRDLAKKYKATYVGRPDKPKGKKAGNINYAIRHVVKEEYFAIFDADQAPEPEFFEETMDYFVDPKVGFVQTPQYFIGERTLLERAVKVSNNIFYQAQCVAKARDGALPFCGTNAVFRREAFVAVNGFLYYTATEDIELGLRLNDIGYHGEYVPKNLVFGYAPPNFKEYMVQQYRWANGNLAILRESFMKFFSGNFSLRHQIHTFFTLGWWSIGFVTLVYILVPVLSLWLASGTHHTWLPMSLLILLYLNVAVGVLMIYVSLNRRISSDKVTIGDAFLQYSLMTNSFIIYLKAWLNAILLKRYVGFIVTGKERGEASLRLVSWNLFFAAITFVSAIYALFLGARATEIIGLRTYIPISLWLLFYTVILASSVLFVGKSNEVTA